MPLMERLAAAIAPGHAIEAGDGAAAIAEDVRRLDALLAGDDSASGHRLWTNSRCLVTTRRFAAMPDFPAAAAASAARGWPVHVRSSGGTTVVHRPGMLNVSRFERWSDEADYDCDGAFQRFCEELVGSLGAIGVQAKIGSVPFSHCDGRRNLTVHGRKIAGTACLVRRRNAWSVILSHAAVWISGDIATDLQAISRFERDLRLDGVYSPQAHSSLQAITEISY